MQGRYAPLSILDVMEEIIWNDKPKSNFLEDLKSFASSLDYYSIVLILVKKINTLPSKMENTNF